jgi:beta-lactamase regulating signal transducer with metallopeptidase domain
MSPWVEAWWSWIVPASLQSALLGALALCCDRPLARRALHGVRAGLWALVLVPFALPALGWWSLASTSPAPLGAAEDPGARAALKSLELVAAGWGAVAVSLVALRVVALRRARRCLATAELRPRPPAWFAEELARSLRRQRLQRAPRVRFSRALGEPAVRGILAPELWLPAEVFERHPRSEVRALLQHELAHLARRDPLRAELGEVARALLWFHPLVHVALRRLGELAEIDCDGRARIALGAEEAGYRATLAAAVRRLVAGDPLGTLAFSGRGAALSRRLEALRAPAVARGRAPLLVFALCLPLALPVCTLERDARWRDQAQAVLAAQSSGARQSCFVLHAAALALRGELPSPSPTAME